MGEADMLAINEMLMWMTLLWVQLVTEGPRVSSQSSSLEFLHAWSTDR